MKLLLAEDDLVYARLLRRLLESEYEVIETHDGSEAWEVLRARGGPQLAVLDWLMPKLNGIEVCRRVRSTPGLNAVYLLLLTAQGDTRDVLAGFASGADDYLRKPCQPEELRARVQVGRRVIELQNALGCRVRELEEALSRVRQLQGLLPICSYCKRIRNDQDYWEQLETFIGEHSDASFSHGICPECYRTIVEPQLEVAKALKQAGARHPEEQPEAESARQTEAGKQETLKR